MNADATFTGLFQQFQMDRGALMLRNTGGQKANVESKLRCSCGTGRCQNTSQTEARCCSDPINTGAFSVPFQDDFIRADLPPTTTLDTRYPISRGCENIGSSRTCPVGSLALNPDHRCETRLKRLLFCLLPTLVHVQIYSPSLL